MRFRASIRFSYLNEYVRPIKVTVAIIINLYGVLEYFWSFTWRQFVLPVCVPNNISGDYHYLECSKCITYCSVIVNVDFSMRGRY